MSEATSDGTVTGSAGLRGCDCDLVWWRAALVSTGAKSPAQPLLQSVMAGLLSDARELASQRGQKAPSKGFVGLMWLLGWSPAVVHDYDHLLGLGSGCRVSL